MDDVDSSDIEDEVDEIVDDGANDESMEVAMLIIVDVEADPADGLEEADSNPVKEDPDVPNDPIDADDGIEKVVPAVGDDAVDP